MSDNLPMVSVVIPCYNEMGSLYELHERIRAEFTRLEISAEILFIDDGSTDGSRHLLRELAADDPECRVVYFRRNCGKAAALQTGFDLARGEYIITMDADLQDDPQEIPRFLDALQKMDVVSGWKAQRHDPLGKTLPSRLFNATVRHVTGVKLHDMNCGFKGYRRDVIKEVRLYGEFHRFIPALAAARGFRIGELVVTHHPRRSGVSKYGWERFLRGFCDLITITYLTRYRTRPLHLFGGIAVGTMLFALALGASLSVYLTADIIHPPAWHFFMWLLAAALFTMSPIFFALGLIAEGQLASALPQLPPPPIVGCLNFGEAETIEEPEATDAADPAPTPTEPDAGARLSPGAPQPGVEQAEATDAAPAPAEAGDAS